ncbi:MAG: hypothetical protein M0002_10570 [Rhodospirillales bacterium]|nr:hypothetical protein [Rhodospirillales bacterium]
MRPHEPPLLDLTPEGEFRRPARPPWAMRLAGWAIVVALIAGGLAVAAVFFWLALLLIPVAIVAALLAYGALRFQLWRNRR